MHQWIRSPKLSQKERTGSENRPVYTETNPPNVMFIPNEPHRATARNAPWELHPPRAPLGSRRPEGLPLAGKLQRVLRERAMSGTEIHPFLSVFVGPSTFPIFVSGPTDVLCPTQPPHGVTRGVDANRLEPDDVHCSPEKRSNTTAPAPTNTHRASPHCLRASSLGPPEIRIL